MRPIDHFLRDAKYAHERPDAMPQWSYWDECQQRPEISKMILLIVPKTGPSWAAQHR